MIEVIQAQNLHIADLKAKFGLQLADDDQFFTEWFQNLPEISDLEKQVLDRAKANYLSLVERREISENMVKITVLGPLLIWTDFYQLPFDIIDEKSVEIAVADEEQVVRGRLDIMVLKDSLWLLVIESKSAGLSILNGIPQALAYMLANPHSAQPVFGLVTNGDDYQFIKLINQDSPRYVLSNKFTLSNQGENELYPVLKGLKNLSQVVPL